MMAQISAQMEKLLKDAERGHAVLVDRVNPM
jgi:hypothetical protein